MPHLELLIMETVDQKLCYQFTRNYIISLPTCKWTDSLKVDIDWHAIYLFFFFSEKIQVSSGQDAYESSVFSPQRNLFGEKIYNQMVIEWASSLSKNIIYDINDGYLQVLSDRLLPHLPLWVQFQ